jgi:hypothetical protein
MAKQRETLMAKHLIHNGLRNCPAEPKHGPLLAVEGMIGLYCPHQSHDGHQATAGREQVAPSQNRWMLDDPALKQATQ